MFFILDHGMYVKCQQMIILIDFELNLVDCIYHKFCRRFFFSSRRNNDIDLFHEIDL